MQLIITFSKHIPKTIQNDWFFETFKRELNEYSEKVILYLLRGKKLESRFICERLISVHNINVFKYMITIIDFARTVYNYG